MSAFKIDLDSTDGPFSDETGNNWNEVTTVARTDQASGLATTKMTLNPVKNALRKTEDYYTWKRIVQTYLELRGLDGLIDYKLPRPAQNSPNSQMWFYGSKAIGEWLIANISTDIHNRIQARCTLLFADEIWKAIYEEMHRYSIYEDMKQVAAFVNLKRTHYPTATAFIDDYRVRYMRLKERELEVKPFFAMLTIMNEIHQIDVRDSVLESLKEKNLNAQTFTHNLFCTYTQDLRDRLSSRE
ncbi:hypothetical protein N7466_009994 [Penicillium verhagenii]|uniref:uncharacterized protein n=1 Tax=Penicillium verhagenii TaxID=1562060 RepID=UPI002545A1AA|nr:uncharacterized protein N7466_009994 [Penicillium verhagenii]KAJ5919051.1 hypothetical protein N7466_009994 [Penicillium verhagenii]